MTGPAVGPAVYGDGAVQIGRPVIITPRPTPSAPGVTLPGAGSPGRPGRGVQSAEVRADGHLIITYTDGVADDVGDVTAEVTLTDEDRAQLAAQVSYLHVQSAPATVWTVPHGLNRGIVSCEVYSADYSIHWDGVSVQPLDDDTVRLSFDDPTAGIALVL